MNYGFKQWAGIGLLSALSLAVIAGCGPSAPSNRPKTNVVTGKVTYQGAPVEGATVSFLPADPKGRGAVGRTDASGQYKLTTFGGGGDGAVAGSYRVTVAKTTTKSKLTEEQEKEYMGKGTPIPPPDVTEGLPVKYKQDATSGLTADVKEGGGTFDFELKD